MELNLWGFGWSVFILWLCCFMCFILKAPDTIYGVYFAIGYFVIESLFLLKQLLKKE